MRYDLKKYLFFGSVKERQRFFTKAQELGVIHFIEKQLPEKLPDAVQEYTNAFKILRGLPSRTQKVADESLADSLVHEILQLKEALHKLEAEEHSLSLEIARLAAFGDFSQEERAAIEQKLNKKVQFYSAKLGTFQRQDLSEELLYMGSDNALDHFMAFNKTAKQYPKMVEICVTKAPDTLKQAHAKVVEELHQKEHKLKNYAQYNSFLLCVFTKKLDHFHLHQAARQTELQAQGHLFAIEGWVPVNKIAAVEQLAQELQLNLEPILTEKNERIPTYLENRGLSQVGEDLVHVYDTPSPTDKDPSNWLLFFFALFFALIIGDAGYGLVFLIAALYMRYRCSFSALGKRLSTLVLILGTATLLWGLLTNAFFGLQLSPDNPLRKFSLLAWMVEQKAAYHIAAHDEVWQEWVQKYPQLQEQRDPKLFVSSGEAIYAKFADNILFELALFIGVIHISLSLMRNLYRNFLGVGWLLFIVGGYLYFPAYLQATSLVHFIFGLSKQGASQIGLYLLIGGICLATLLSLQKNRLSGILEPMFGIQIFSDVMSYLRLYALGLSGAMMALVINDFVLAVPLVFGILIAIVGHSLNIALSLMSGVIHGLRLNYLEWYHYSFEGDGKRFNPLRKFGT